MTADTVVGLTMMAVSLLPFFVFGLMHGALGEWCWDLLVPATALLLAGAALIALPAP